MAEKTKTRTTRPTRIKQGVNQQDDYIYDSAEQSGSNCLTTVNIKFDADNVKRVVTEPWRLTDKHGNMVAFDEVRPQCRLFCFYSPDKTSYACRVTSVVTKGTLKGAQQGGSKRKLEYDETESLVREVKKCRNASQAKKASSSLQRSMSISDNISSDTDELNVDSDGGNCGKLLSIQKPEKCVVSPSGKDLFQKDIQCIKSSLQQVQNTLLLVNAVQAELKSTVDSLTSQSDTSTVMIEDIHKILLKYKQMKVPVKVEKTDLPPHQVQHTQTRSTSSVEELDRSVVMLESPAAPSPIQDASSSEVAFVQDRRLNVMVPFLCLNKAEAAINRTELARNLLDTLFSKEEQACSSITGKGQEKRQLDVKKMEALRSHCMLRFPLGPDENLKVVLNKVNKVLGDKCRFQSKK
ncbi:uncharacterized protein LOC134182579 [Corticium candelabrum]|uniref:uncharacterized protein LOC134182579 n=1 Tax=Corticium candelabrum TaxID=121492 RepID=UPI002E276344|nr:uncharacterized protein LOC134182579 [Corticium candelabrum]